MALLKAGLRILPRRASGLIALALLFFNALQAPAAEPAASREYQIKAVFLFNFAQFADWPAKAFPGPESPLVIGVLGDDPFGFHLDEAVQGERIGQRPLVVRRYQRVEEIDQCHILFISRSETNRLDQIMTGLKDRSLLTVADAEGFAMRGVMIRFINEKNKIRLRINLESVKAAGLTLSSKLLRPAEIVTSINH